MIISHQTRLPDFGSRASIPGAVPPKGTRSNPNMEELGNASTEHD